MDVICSIGLELSDVCSERLTDKSLLSSEKLSTEAPVKQGPLNEEESIIESFYR